MTKYLRFFGLAFAVVALSGCASLSSFTNTPGSRHAAKVTLTVYVEVVQPAMIAYGRLPDCNPAPKPLCKDHGAWVKIQAASAAAHSAIQTAAPLLFGNATDPDGKIDKALLEIDNAQTAFAEKAGAL